MTVIFLNKNPQTLKKQNRYIYIQDFKPNNWNYNLCLNEKFKFDAKNFLQESNLWELV